MLIGMETTVPEQSDQTVLAQWFPYLSTKVHTMMLLTDMVFHTQPTCNKFYLASSPEGIVQQF
eukprot:15366261-Ditylum_brightwellii.AAC.1